jgi:hypothetical protein
MPNKVALEISEHSDMLVTVDLNLEIRDIITLFVVLGEVVSFIDILDCFLKLNSD